MSYVSIIWFFVILNEYNFPFNIFVQYLETDGIIETLPEEVSAGKTIVESLNESLPVNTTDDIDRQEVPSQENISTARNLHGGLNKRCDEGSVAEPNEDSEQVSGENLPFFDLMWFFILCHMFPLYDFS